MFNNPRRSFAGVAGGFGVCAEGARNEVRGTYDLITTKFFDWNAKASVGYTF